MYNEIKYSDKFVNLFLFFGQVVTFLWPFIGCLHILHFGALLVFLLPLLLVDVVGTTKK